MFFRLDEAGDNQARARLHAAGMVNSNLVHTFYLLCRTKRFLEILNIVCCILYTSIIGEVM